jgi:geranylgeranyl pyrophosphate synthase
LNAVSFIAPVQEELQALEKLMRSQANGYTADLRAALDLLISAGGKRIRPAFSILTGKMLGAPHVELMNVAAAIELLHTATLVHDDLIDGSILRRGMPTLNSRWSPGATVLTGDFIFARAAKMAAETDSVPVMTLFSHTLTVIVDGEIVQLLGSSRCKADRENYNRRIYAKTASLFETAGKSAALVSPVDDEVVDIMGRFGCEIGMAFQVVDDILDFTGEQTTVGKPVGSDLRQGIVTLPAIYYAEDHPEDPDAQYMIRGECLPTEGMAVRLVNAIRSSDAIHKSHQEAVQYVERALELLRSLPATTERYALEDLANYIVQREL